MVDKYDPQQERAYRWESRFIHSTIQAFRNVHGARKWVRWACKLYKIPPPVVQVKAKHKRDFSCYRLLDHRIQLLVPHLNVWATLHEASHAIAWKLFEDNTHGPRWLGIYLFLLASSGIAPLSALTASAKAEGLKWSYIGNIAPTKVRKRMRTTKFRRSHR